MSTAVQRIEVFQDTMNWIKSDNDLFNSVIKAKKNTEIFWENDYPVFDQNKRFDTKITVSKHRRFPSIILNSMVRRRKCSGTMGNHIQSVHLI